MAGMHDMHGLGEDLLPFPMIIGDNKYTFFLRQSAVAFISERKCK